MQTANFLPASVQDCLSRPFEFKLCSETACVPLTEPCPCNVKEFECADRRCIPLQLVCNGSNDCFGGEDEYCSDSSDLGSRLSITEITAIVSGSVFICAVVIILLCLYYLRRQRSNISQESQAEPLQMENPSDDTYNSDKELGRVYKIRYKHLNGNATTPYDHYSKSSQNCSKHLGKLECHEEQQLNSKSEEQHDNSNNCEKSCEQLNNAETDKAVSDINSGSSIMYSCQSSPSVKCKNAETDSTVPPQSSQPCSEEESQTKVGKYIFRPRTSARGAPNIYHSYVPSHTEPSTPESVDFDRDKISFLFAHELLCASTPKQAVKKQLVLHGSQDIDFIDETNSAQTTFDNPNTNLQRPEINYPSR